MSVLRPLPPRPSLEFERKEAKALLRRLRAGDPDTLVRARATHLAFAQTPPAVFRLADAQLVIAREYGFTSWPRLVHYFEGVARQQRRHRSTHDVAYYESRVRGVIAEHRDRRAMAGRMLAAYVPRFYGMRVDDVLASSITGDDARLAVARNDGFPSWEVLVSRASTEPRPGPDVDPERRPQRRAMKALETSDVGALQALVDECPELLHAHESEVARGGTLLNLALDVEQRTGRDAMRPIMAWLAGQGLDLQRELNEQLCGRMKMPVERVRFLLERGADANWVAPNGIPVLEHALIRYWDGDAVGVLAERATPRSALWIAAGLGDVEGVRKFLDRNGRPVADARRNRPPFDAVSLLTMPSLPDPDDEELLLEAFFVAMLNGRAPVLEYMASRGFDVNTLAWDSPLVNFAVGNAMVPVLEALLRAGADLDLRGWRPAQTAREMAAEMFAGKADDPRYGRILELCGVR